MVVPFQTDERNGLLWEEVQGYSISETLDRSFEFQYLFKADLADVRIGETALSWECLSQQNRSDQ